MELLLGSDTREQRLLREMCLEGDRQFVRQKFRECSKIKEQNGR